MSTHSRRLPLRSGRIRALSLRLASTGWPSPALSQLGFPVAKEGAMGHSNQGTIKRLFRNGLLVGGLLICLQARTRWWLPIRLIRLPRNRPRRPARLRHTTCRESRAARGGRVCGNSDGRVRVISNNSAPTSIQVVAALFNAWKAIPRKSPRNAMRFCRSVDKEGRGNRGSGAWVLGSGDAPASRRSPLEVRRLSAVV